MQYLLVDDFGLKFRDEKPGNFNYKIGSQDDPEPFEVWCKRNSVRKLLWFLLCEVVSHPRDYLVKSGDSDEVSAD